MVDHNVASNSSLAWAFFMTGGGNLPAKNNHLQNFWYENDLPPQNNCAAFNCTVDDSTVYKVVGSVWPAEAQTIMDEAGVRSM